MEAALATNTAEQTSNGEVLAQLEAEFSGYRADIAALGLNTLEVVYSLFGTFGPAEIVDHQVIDIAELELAHLTLVQTADDTDAVVVELFEGCTAESDAWAA